MKHFELQRSCLANDKSTALVTYYDNLLSKLHDMGNTETEALIRTCMEVDVDPYQIMTAPLSVLGPESLYRDGATKYIISEYTHCLILQSAPDELSPVMAMFANFPHFYTPDYYMATINDAVGTSARPLSMIRDDRKIINRYYRLASNPYGLDTERVVSQRIKLSWD